MKTDTHDLSELLPGEGKIGKGGFFSQEDRRKKEIQPLVAKQGKIISENLLISGHFAQESRERGNGLRLVTVLIRVCIPASLQQLLYRLHLYQRMRRLPEIL